tara:strand:- start:401 stop:1069 length:669 start_codon:yes stop_codon:yes gene_type:complete
MSLPYFRYLPNIDYVSRLPDSKYIGDYVQVKNLFRRAKINPELFQNINFFTKYTIIGNERPDNIAYKLYDNPYLDWLVLLANNIINVEEEWPLTQQSFFNYMLNKYGSETAFNEPHHYETSEVKDSNGRVVMKKGLEVHDGYSITYFDSGNNQLVTSNNISVVVTNYDYEDKIQDSKRDIFVVKGQYLSQIINDLEDGLLYKSGSSQYVSENIAKADNIRLY